MLASSGIRVYYIEYVICEFCTRFLSFRRNSGSSLKPRTAFGIHVRRLLVWSFVIYWSHLFGLIILNHSCMWDFPVINEINLGDLEVGRWLPPAAVRHRHASRSAGVGGIFSCLAALASFQLSHTAGTVHFSHRKVPKEHHGSGGAARRVDCWESWGVVQVNEQPFHPSWSFSSFILWGNTMGCKKSPARKIWKIEQRVALGLQTTAGLQ